MKKYLLFIAIFCSLFYSCHNSNSVAPPLSGGNNGPGSYYIINEGSFGQNNSSITFYNPENGDLINNAYYKANNKSLGDVANSMYVFNDKGYIAVNGSNKIEIIDLKTFISEGFIDLGSTGSPREVYVQNETTGYVTSFSGQVIRFNPETKLIINRTYVGEHPDGMIQAAGKLFVANSWFGDYADISRSVSVIDTSAGVEGLRINVGINPTKIIQGPDGFIYVICSGSYTDTTIFSGIYKINPVTNFVVDSIKVNHYPFEACFVSSTNMLVANNDGVFLIDIPRWVLSLSPLIPLSAVTTFPYSSIYSLAFDNTRQWILCGNPKDYQQNGEAVIFDLYGHELKRFDTGINPGTIIIR